MLKSFLAFILTCFFLNTQAQTNFPSYIKVVTTYFKRYIKQEDYDGYLNFAKKKNGWYCQRINILKSNQLVDEEAFWTPENGYNPNLSFDKREMKDSAYISRDVISYVKSATNPWYGYDRCRYFGYTGWEYDLINEYGKTENLNDTLLEGLARAYSSLASSYLWYQQGGGVLNQDTLQRQLERLELPSAARIAKVKDYLAKSIEVYKKLEKQNPDYECIVGNITLKKFNETIHGYMQMSMSLQKNEAANYMEQSNLQNEYIQQAKNYLNSCDSNAILFTYGDNDTYQLWYCQEKLHFRKDVIVINTSMLGLPVYIDMLKKSNTVSFKATSAFYGKKESEYAYYKKESPRPRKMELQKLLHTIYAFKKSIPYIDVEGKSLPINAFNVQDITIHISPKNYNSHSSFKTKDSVIKITLKDYILLNDIIMLDIIASNINTRPVYFTSSSTGLLDSNLLQQGIVFKLFPKTKPSKQLDQNEIKRLEFFVEKIYNPVISFKSNNAEHFCHDGNNVFFQVYSKIAGFYNDKNDAKQAKKWIEKCLKIYPKISSQNFPGAYSLISQLQLTSPEKLKEFGEAYATHCFDKCTKNSAIIGLISKEECNSLLDEILITLHDAEIESDYIYELINKLSIDYK